MASTLLYTEVPHLLVLIHQVYDLYLSNVMHFYESILFQNPLQHLTVCLILTDNL